MPATLATLRPEEICSQLAAGNQGTLQALIKTYYSDLYKFTWKFVRSQEIAEELTQDIFIYLWENRESLTINSAVKPYLYTMARNRAFNYLKSRVARMSVVSDEVPETDAANAQTPEEEMNQQELEQLVAEGIAQLPEKCRIVFNLSRQEGMSYQQIADELQISPKTVEAHMGTALKKLRTFLRNSWGEALVFLLLMLSR